jgi:hypothetical protein
MLSGGRLVGVWRRQSGPLRLGSLLTFLAELAVVKRIRGAAVVDVRLESSAQRDGRGSSVADIILPHMAAIDSFCWVETFEPEDAAWQWPEDLAHHDYQSSEVLQQLYDAHGTHPEIHVSPELVGWADAWLREHGGGAWPVVVHLKNNLRGWGESNADFSVWYDFMNRYLTSPVFFILIGNEQVDRRIDELENTLIANSFGLSLVQELALIERAGAFMGMSSGPCNMAIFNRVPYAIFKNPDHHASAMARELGERDHFLFASPEQRFLRQRETPQLLVREFTRLFSHVRIKS